MLPIRSAPVLRSKKRGPLGDYEGNHKPAASFPMSTRREQQCEVRVPIPKPSMAISIFLETDLQSLSEVNWRVKKCWEAREARSTIASIHIACFLRALNLALARCRGVDKKMLQALPLHPKISQSLGRVAGGESIYIRQRIDSNSASEPSRSLLHQLSSGRSLCSPTRCKTGLRFPATSPHRIGRRALAEKQRCFRRLRARWRGKRQEPRSPA